MTPDNKLRQLEIIKRIIESKRIADKDRIWYISNYINHWLSEEDIKWLWD